jgi:hypothetical protein
VRTQQKKKKKKKRNPPYSNCLASQITIFFGVGVVVLIEGIKLLKRLVILWFFLFLDKLFHIIVKSKELSLKMKLIYRRKKYINT